MRASSPILLCLLALACAPNRPPTGGTHDRAGLGDDCTVILCRDGLICDPSTHLCVGSMMSNLGAPCVIGVECTSGQCGPNGPQGECVDAGVGMAGGGCKGDADCAAGLRCGFDGQSLFPKCVPAGMGDVGKDCATSNDCAQGIYCVRGKCAEVPLPAKAALNGYPPVAPDPTLTWPGVACPDEKAPPITALFELPRASDPATVMQDFFRLPFPNDAARATDGTLDFSRFPRDPSPAFGFDALGRYLEVLKTETFPAYGTVVFRFDGPVQFAGFGVLGNNPQTRIVDLTNDPANPMRFGDGRGISFNLHGVSNRYVCGPWVAVRPFNGDPMPPGTYAVVMLIGITDENGGMVHSSPDLQAVLGTTQPTDTALADAWTKYAPLRTYLAMKSILPQAVLNATVFTVADPQRVVGALAQSVSALPPPVADGWVKCGSGAAEPCPDATGDRACGTSSAFDEWHALVDVPIFQEGEAPYLTPAQGGNISAGASVVRREKVCAALTVPKGAPPAAGWPLVLYAHGTGGSYRAHAADGSGAALASATVSSGGYDGGALPGGYAVLGFDQVGHGPRRGDGGQDVSPNDIVFNFGNPASARGTMAQGAADLFSFTAYAKSLDAADAGLPALDTRRLVFWGHSQGATEGALFLAEDRSVPGTVLSGASASLTDALLSKRSPINIADNLWIALSESSSDAVDQSHPVLSLLQTWTDPVDPVNFARYDVVVPPSADGGMPLFARDVFQVWGRNDTYTAQPVQRTFTEAADLTFVGQNIDDFGTVPLANVQGNVRVGPFAFTAAMRQYDPGDGGYDGHFVVYFNDQARRDATRFIIRSVSGDVPLVPEP